MVPYLYSYDIHKKQVTADCTLYPTQVNKTDFPWLYARNNKYEDSSVEPDKVGKWMIFASKDSVNSTWDQIKAAVTNGDLWSTKVSANCRQQPSHAIMIYTKDYTDVSDVINVLDFLESSGIKPAGAKLYYKPDALTYAGVYSGGKQRPWIYSSDTVRQNPSTGLGRSALQSGSNSTLPSEVNYSDRPWLYAENNKYGNETLDPDKFGKWMLFVSKDRVDSTWNLIKIAVANSDLWTCKVSTNNPQDYSHAIMVCTKDYSDLNDVVKVLDFLESSGIKDKKVRSYYKTDLATRAGIKSCIYCSETIREQPITIE